MPPVAAPARAGRLSAYCSGRRCPGSWVPSSSLHHRSLLRLCLPSRLQRQLLVELLPLRQPGLPALRLQVVLADRAHGFDIQAARGRDQGIEEGVIGATPATASGAVTTASCDAGEDSSGV